MKNFNKTVKEYWKGNTSVEDEKHLKKYFEKEENQDIDGAYFSYLQSKKEEKLNSPGFDEGVLKYIQKEQGTKKNTFLKKYWQYAAIITVLITFAILFTARTYNNQNTVHSKELTFIDTYDDPELAFEQTKKALLLVSANLNKGMEYTEHLVKFSETQEKIKN